MTDVSDDEKYRTEWLSGLTKGFNTPADLFLTAHTVDGSALRNVPLTSVLGALPDSTSESVAEDYDRIVSGIRGRKGHNPDRSLTVGWLIGSPGVHTRLMDWLDVYQPRSSEFPWAVFPWTRRQVTRASESEGS